MLILIKVYDCISISSVITRVKVLRLGLLQPFYLTLLNYVALAII